MTAVELLKRDLDSEMKSGTKMVVNWDMYLELERIQHGKTWDIALDKYEVRAGNYMRAYEDFDDYFVETYANNHIVDTNEMIDHIGDANEMVEDTFKVWECCGMEECECGLTPDELIIKDMYNQITSFQTEISDEEIEKWVASTPYYGHCTTEYKEGLEDGIKWYREQLKKKQL